MKGSTRSTNLRALGDRVRGEFGVLPAINPELYARLNARAAGYGSELALILATRRKLTESIRDLWWTYLAMLVVQRSGTYEHELARTCFDTISKASRRGDSLLSLAERLNDLHRAATARRGRQPSILAASLKRATSKQKTAIFKWIEGQFLSRFDDDANMVAAMESAIRRYHVGVPDGLRERWRKQKARGNDTIYSSSLRRQLHRYVVELRKLKSDR